MHVSVRLQAQLDWHLSACHALLDAFVLCKGNISSASRAGWSVQINNATLHQWTGMRSS